MTCIVRIHVVGRGRNVESRPHPRVVMFCAGTVRNVPVGVMECYWRTRVVVTITNSTRHTRNGTKCPIGTSLVSTGTVVVR